MTAKYQPLRDALAAVPCVKWTAQRATVNIPETEDWAGKYLSIDGLDKQVARKLARYIADANPATVRNLLVDADRAAALEAERDRLRAENNKLRSALEVARLQIEIDRDGLIACHGVLDPLGVRTIPKEDVHGQDGLREYNKTLEFINAALAQEQS